MDIHALFESKARQLFWRAIPPEHVVGEIAVQVLEPQRCYVVVRLTEMYLASCRKMWKQVYPLLQCYIEHGGIEYAAIVGPAQLAKLGDDNLDRITNLNQRLLGPSPYTGGDIALLAGLYSVPGHDYAAVLVDTLAGLSALVEPGLSSKALPLAGLLKKSLERVLGLDQATLHLGVQDTLHACAAPLSTGFYAGIAAAVSEVDMNQLWIRDGRLYKGAAAVSAKPYDDHDYMLLELERVDARPDWPTLPVVSDLTARFGRLLADGDLNIPEKRARMGRLWPGFVQGLADCGELTAPDRERIRDIVAADLIDRLHALEAENPFLKAA